MLIDRTLIEYLSLIAVVDILVLDNTFMWLELPKDQRFALFITLIPSLSMAVSITVRLVAWFGFGVLF